MVIAAVEEWAVVVVVAVGVIVVVLFLQRGSLSSPPVPFRVPCPAPQTFYLHTLLNPSLTAAHDFESTSASRRGDWRQGNIHHQATFGKQTTTSLWWKVACVSSLYSPTLCCSLLCVECCSAYAYHSAICRLLVVARNTSLPCVSAIHLLHSQYVLIIRLCSTPAILAIRLCYSCAIRRWLYAARHLLLLLPDA